MTSRELDTRATLEANGETTDHNAVGGSTFAPTPSLMDRFQRSPIVQNRAVQVIVLFGATAALAAGCGGAKNPDTDVADGWESSDPPALAGGNSANQNTGNGNGQSQGSESECDTTAPDYDPQLPICDTAPVDEGVSYDYDPVASTGGSADARLTPQEQLDSFGGEEREVLKRVFECAGIDNFDSYVPLEKGPEMIQCMEEAGVPVGLE